MKFWLVAYSLFVGTLIVPARPAIAQSDQDKCNAGDAAACEKAGNFFANPWNKDRNFDLGAELLAKACRMKRVDGCKGAFNIFRQKSNYRDAYSMLDLACSYKDGISCYKMGMAMERGRGTKFNLSAAQAAYFKAVNLIETPGGSDAYIMSSTESFLVMDIKERIERLAKPKVNRVAETAPDLVQQLSRCDEGEGEQCYHAGMRYAKGDGVAASTTLAFELFEDGCPDFGTAKLFVKACHNAGVAYVTGTGAKQNFSTAFQRFFEGCKRGFFRSCTELGGLFANGKGVSKSPEKAFENFKKACIGNEPLGCREFGRAHEFGLGVLVDKKMAVDMYRKALRLNKDPVLATTIKGDLARLEQ